MNGADLIVVIAVAAAVLVAVAIMGRDWKNGKCGCRCPGCGGSCGKGAPSHRNRRTGRVKRP